MIICNFSKASLQQQAADGSHKACNKRPKTSYERNLRINREISLTSGDQRIYYMGFNVTKITSSTNNCIKYACPECKKDIERIKTGYVCNDCHQTYPLLDGIPTFSDLSTYYGEIKKSNMTTLLQDAEKSGYKMALRDHFKDPFVYKYTVDESRAKWIEIIPHNKETHFLDVGCGWGTNSVPISRKVKVLHALDATIERVKFVQIRATQEKINNIKPVMGSAIKLPFPDKSFDIVAFNGVIEWLGAIDKDVDPIQIQLAALNEARRVLKPNGYVYIGIENRFSLKYFLGNKDDHSYIRFTSLMPRWLANIYCKLRNGDNYFTHTYSLGVYLKMLRQNGFGSVQSYYPWPTYRNPTTFIPLSKNNITEHLDTVIKNSSSLRKFFYLSLLKSMTAVEGKGRLVHSFCFVAKKYS